MDIVKLLGTFEVQIFIVISFVVIIIVLLGLIIRFRKYLFGTLNFFENIESLKASIAVISTQSIDMTAFKQELSHIRNSIDARTMIDKACLFECDENGRCVSANSSLCDLFEASTDQMLGLGWSQFIHPEDAHNALEQWSRAVKNGQHELVFSFRIKNEGKWINVTYKAVFVYDKEKNLRRVYGTAWKSKHASRELEYLRCIAEAVSEIKGTETWRQLQNEVKRKKTA